MSKLSLGNAVLVSLALAALISGCAATRRLKVPSDDSVWVIDYGAQRRGTYVIPSKASIRIVSEPAPDVAQEIVASLGLSAKTIGEVADANVKAEYASRVIDLASRSQTLQVLREALFRLAEMGASSGISDQDRVALYQQVLRTVQTIAVTELAQVVEGDEKRETLIKRYLEDVRPGDFGSGEP